MRYSWRSTEVLFILAGLMVSSWFLGCATRNKKEQEPNNTRTQANPIRLNQSIAFSLPLQDQDWFKLEVENRGYLKIRNANPLAEPVLEVMYFLTPASGKRSKTYTRNWHILPDAMFIPEPGTVIFGIRNPASPSVTIQSACIQTDFLADFDAMEPNDSPSQAKTIVLGNTVHPALYPQRDRDWLRFQMDQPGYVVLKASRVPAHLVPEARFWQWDEWDKKTMTNLRTWHALPTACFFNQPGHYYIELKAQSPENSAEGYFDFKMDYLPPMDKYEPNDSPNSAKRISRGETIRSAVFPIGDLDYFRIHIQEAGKLSFFALGYEDIIPEIALFPCEKNLPDGNIELHGDWRDFPAQYEVKMDQEYYVLIHDKYDDESSSRPFQIKVE